MKRRSFLKHASLGVANLGILRLAQAGPGLAHQPFDHASRGASSSGVKTILSFATEAAHAVEDHDFIKSIAQFLTAENLVGNFHLTGDYARALKRHGRLDVVEALRPHEIGFHCNHHGSRPFMAGYLEKYPWEEGVARWLRHEAPGFAVVGELFNRPPRYYTTEFSKAAQTIYGGSLMGAGIAGSLRVPMREHSAVWFCNSFAVGMENIVPLESFHAPGDRERIARERLDQSREKQQANGKDVLRVFLHSYKYYTVAPYNRLTMTSEIYKNDDLYFEDYPLDFVRQPPEQFQRAFEMFKRSIRHHARQSEFVTFSQYRAGFRENAGTWIGLAELDRLGDFLSGALDAYWNDSLSVSPAEAFALFVRVLRSWLETGQLPSRVFIRNVIGPHAPIPESLSDRTIRPEELWKLLPQIDRELDTALAIPATVTIGQMAVGPGQLLRGLVQAYRGIRGGARTSELALSGANLPEIAKEAFFQERTFTRVGLYPDGFTGEKICAMCRAQSWSWKPAVRRSVTAG